ncbi:MAG: helix-hairpin-helix domain-containing protein [Candidatus Omnitrophota bacterium]
MLALTKQERQVLISLGFIFWVGITFQYLSKKNPHLAGMVDILGSEAIYYQVDINHATKEELIRIPYIGEFTAQRIIDYREKNGPFDDIEQLQAIKSIPGKNYEKFRRHLKVTPSRIKTADRLPGKIRGRGDLADVQKGHEANPHE